MVLTEGLKDEKSWARARGKCRQERAIACRSNVPNLSIRTAVISTATASNNLMINYWQSLSLLLSFTFSLSLSVSVSLPSLTPFLSQRLDTGSNMKAADLCLGLSRVILLPVPCNPTPTRCCHGTCQVATGTLISPLIRLLNPGVDSIQPSHMSEKSRSKTPRCLTLQKLTRVPLPSSPLLSPISSSKTPYFLLWKWKDIFDTSGEKWIFDVKCNVFASPLATSDGDHIKATFSLLYCFGSHITSH